MEQVLFFFSIAFPEATNFNKYFHSHPSVYWNPTQGIITPGLPEEFGNAADLNVQIQKMIRVAEDLVIFAEKNEPEDVGTFVKNSFHPNFKVGSLDEKQKQPDGSNRKKNLDLFFQIDDYINSRIRRYARICLAFTGT
jgi:hypothetical protein